MFVQGITWVSEQPRIEPDGDGVIFTLVSGACECVFRMHRHAARLSAHRMLRMLDDLDIADEQCVIDMQERRAG